MYVYIKKEERFVSKLKANQKKRQNNKFLQKVK